MKKLGKTGYSVLKIIHILSAGVWLGAVVAVTVLLAALKADNLKRDIELMLFIDFSIFIPCAIVCLITGILFSVFTQWGFKKHWWIIVKYIVNFIPIITGGPLVARSLFGMAAITEKLGANAFVDDAFQRLHKTALFVMVLYLVLFIFVYIISVVKPKHKALVHLNASLP